jgi:hypothetical protein
MVSKKDRRKSGWYTPTSTIKLNKKEIVEQCLEPQIEYDDWSNWRDGFRGFSIIRDKTRLTPAQWNKINNNIKIKNKQIKKKIKIRKVRKVKNNNIK